MVLEWVSFKEATSHSDEKCYHISLLHIYDKVVMQSYPFVEFELSSTICSRLFEVVLSPNVRPTRVHFADLLLACATFVLFRP